VACGAIAGRAAEGTRGMTGLALNLLVRRIEEESRRIVVEGQGLGACGFGLRECIAPLPQHSSQGDEEDSEETAQKGQKIVIRLN